MKSRMEIQQHTNFSIFKNKNREHHPSIDQCDRMRKSASMGVTTHDFSIFKNKKQRASSFSTRTMDRSVWQDTTSALSKAKQTWHSIILLHNCDDHSCSPIQKETSSGNQQLDGKHFLQIHDDHTLDKFKANTYSRYHSMKNRRNSEHSLILIFQACEVTGCKKRDALILVILEMTFQMKYDHWDLYP